LKERLVISALLGSGAPWRAKSVLLALIIVLIGGGFWVAGVIRPHSAASVHGQNETVNSQAQPQGWDFSQPLPLAVRLSASYIGGFFIGWLFRRFIALSFAVAGLALLLVGFGKFAGCNTVETEKQVKTNSVTIQHEAKEARDYLKSLLPSASVGAFGAFLGFRRKQAPRA
jgi:uncharacterized membrane protein (Fun14 family)